jgi:DNA-binding transcriptional LysR family regulator
MDRVTNIMTFVKVVDTGGFAAAARALNVSPSVVTNHVQSLEAHLGARLLNRTTRQVNLTEIGQAYYERCVRILAEIEEADHVAESLQSKPRGTLRLNTSPGMPPAIAPVIARLVSLYPDLSVDTVATGRMVDLVEEGFDLAIRGHAIPDSSLIIRRLATYRMMICGAPEYLAKRGTPKRPADLANHNCLHFSDTAWDGRKWLFARGGVVHSLSISGNLSVNNIDALRRAALLGQGLIFLPTFDVAEDIEAGRLVQLLAEFSGPEQPINAIYPHREFMPSKVRSFIDAAIQEFQNATWNGER